MSPSTSGPRTAGRGWRRRARCGLRRRSGRRPEWSSTRPKSSYSADHLGPRVRAMTRLAHDRYCDEIAHQVRQLRDVVTSGADLTATVPTCPDWSLEQLVRHEGGALRWVNALVSSRAEKNIPYEEIPLAGGPEKEGDPSALDAWLAETGDLVVGALREAGP